MPSSVPLHALVTPTAAAAPVYAMIWRIANSRSKSARAVASAPVDGDVSWGTTTPWYLARRTPLTVSARAGRGDRRAAAVGEVDGGVGDAFAVELGDDGIDADAVVGQHKYAEIDSLVRAGGVGRAGEHRTGDAGDGERGGQDRPT